MEVYILDDLLRRDTVIDRFESCIWTERFSAYGDFQLVMYSNSATKRLLQKGLMLGMNKSRRVMMIENVEDKDDSEGRSLITVSGRSLEALMLKRSTRAYGVNSEPIGDNYDIVGVPGAIARNLVERFIYNNTFVPEDNFPFLRPSTETLYRPDTLAEPSMSITAVIENGQLYDELVKIVSAYGLGFRIYKGPDTSRLYFNVYAGNDRTAAQVTLPAVVFSPEMENLSDSSELSSIESEYNVAYVLGKDRSLVVYGSTTDEGISGFDRKVLMVVDRDITGTDAAALERLSQKGLEELSKYKSIQALDGQLPQSSKYVYDVDYSLGDLVEIRNEEGLVQRMRVTEQIFIDDMQGERSYPTLASDLFITPGSWAAYDASGVWDTAVGTWDDQPQ